MNTFASLKRSADSHRKTALKKRISRQPQATDLEYMLGAFIEMYEPHLQELVRILFTKGYTIDASSGFGGKNSDMQVMTGEFTIDYVNKNKLEKIGVKFREYNGTKSFIFWPETASLDAIKAKWLQIIDSLPDKGIVAQPSTSSDAIYFRRKYMPEDPVLQKQRIFERLKYHIQRQVALETKKRLRENPHASKIEQILGLFIEEIEPQVRQAVISMNQKGYSTDSSGFMSNPCDQMIEGDFQLDEPTQQALVSVGARVITNPSGYTQIQFTPKAADVAKIKKEWNAIVSFLPDKKQTASISMTRKARGFRLQFQ